MKMEEVFVRDSISCRSAKDSFWLVDERKTNELCKTELRRLKMEDFDMMDCEFSNHHSETASYINPPKIYRQTLDADNLISVCTKKLEKDPNHK